MTRYDVAGSEGDLQPGSEEGMLRNKLGLTRKQDIDDAEAELLQALYEQELSATIERLAFDDIKRWHRQWLGNLYEWAGSLRTVNLSKGGFHFAAAAQLPLLIGGFEQEYLGQFSDLPRMDDDKVVEFLAQSHVEFILIHPFREGNGRMSRLLLDLMAVKAGFQPLDYQLWADNKDYYFKSIQAGVMDDYQHMERLIRDVLEQQP